MQMGKQQVHGCYRGGIEMDIPAEVVYIIGAVITLGIVVALVIFFSAHSGAPNILDSLGGFFR